MAFLAKNVRTFPLICYFITRVSSKVILLHMKGLLILTPNTNFEHFQAIDVL